MAREYGRVWLSIWSDEDFIALPSGAQRLYLALISQPGMNTCGVQSYAPRRWASLAPDTTSKQIERYVARLETPRLIVVDHATDELLVRGHIRHDRALRSANVAKSLARTWHLIASKPLQRVVLCELQRLFDETGDNGWPGWGLTEIKDLVARPLLGPSERSFERPSERPFDRSSA